MKVRCLFFGVLVAFCSVSAVALEVGTAVAQITPDVTAFKVPLAGYGARLGRPATGVRDALHAKVLYLRDGDQCLAIITCDLRSSTPEFKGQIVEKLSTPGLGLENVMIAASHTHAGPSMYPEKFWQFQFGSYDPEIVAVMTTAIAQAIEAAVAAAVPARVGYAVTRAEGFTRNRRWEETSEDHYPIEAPPLTDPRLVVMRIDDLSGEYLAVVIHFAAHPTIMGAKNMHLSAEWPGVLQQEIEQKYPGCTAYFLNGALGDQAPAGATGTDEYERMENYGRRLAALAADILPEIEMKSDLPIGYVRTTPDLPLLLFSEEAQNKYGKLHDAAREALPTKAEIQAFRIGPLLLTGLPGEPILAVGWAIERHIHRNDIELPLVIGLANDYVGYIVDEKEYARGGYEVESRSFYGPGLGNFFVEQAGHASRMLFQDN